MHYKKERKADSVLLLHAFSFLVSNGFEAQQVQYWGICVWDSPFFFQKQSKNFFSSPKSSLTLAHGTDYSSSDATTSPAYTLLHPPCA